MNWEVFSDHMEQVIKTDDMAVEDACFMACHMPFPVLYVARGGNPTAPTRPMTEEEVFQNLVWNPANEHRLVIVRGDNGTGKSHLIRYMKARFEQSPLSVWNPATEQLIFIRRLNNSVRGVFSQLLEQNVIVDPDFREKLQRFVNSTDAQDEKSFRSSILYSFVNAVQNDNSNETYSPVVCNDLAQFLQDDRMQKHLLRDDGPIDRCSRIITSASNQVLQNTTVFQAEDFPEKVLRPIRRRGSYEAQNFESELRIRETDEEGSGIRELVLYLNRFTGRVVRSSAGISSENTREVFTSLRRHLKQQGKNLTLFVEDFTGFTGIDSELITVLSTEHGGNYSDLCRVTSIIGITNDYYDQFRDNFTDRVTHQIRLEEKSYGSREFLVEMTARYLNAIYCPHKELQQWYQEGGNMDSLPHSDFHPEYPWETAEIGNGKATLYPFTSTAIQTLYDHLPVKSPRYFLKNVLRSQLKAFFDGMQNAPWRFPENPAGILMKRDQHSSAIDRQTALSGTDRLRLKSLLAIWGDGTANGVRKEDGSIFFGGIRSDFLKEIGLGAFQGIGDIRYPVETTEPPQPVSPKPPIDVTPPPPPPDNRRKRYEARVKQLNDWFNGAALRGPDTFKGLIQNFLLGSNNMSGAVCWQDLGFPAYVVNIRLNNAMAYRIEGQDASSVEDRIIVNVNRDAEGRDALLALLKRDYYEGWNFEDAIYFQQRLIVWLEHSLPAIQERLRAQPGLPEPKFTEWCLASQCLRFAFQGVPARTDDPWHLLADVFHPRTPAVKTGRRETPEWNEVSQYLETGTAGKLLDDSWELLRQSSLTIKGNVTGQTTQELYRSWTLVQAAQKLIDAGWDIEDELPDRLPANDPLYNPARCLRELYPRLRKAALAEEAKFTFVCEELRQYTGGLSQDDLLQTFRSIRQLIDTLHVNATPLGHNLDSIYSRNPADTAHDIQSVIQTFQQVQDASLLERLQTYAQNPLHNLSVRAHDLYLISSRAEEEDRKATQNMPGKEQLPEIERLESQVREALGRAYQQLLNLKEE